MPCKVVNKFQYFC